MTYDEGPRWWQLWRTVPGSVALAALIVIPLFVVVAVMADAEGRKDWEIGHAAGMQCLATYTRADCVSACEMAYGDNAQAGCLRAMASPYIVVDDR